MIKHAKECSIVDKINNIFIQVNLQLCIYSDHPQVLKDFCFIINKKLGRDSKSGSVGNCCQNIYDDRMRKLNGCPYVIGRPL